MKLLDVVTAEVGGDQQQALAGLGAVFLALRFACDPDTFTQVKRAVPEAESWAKQAALGSAGRTAELFALVTPDTLNTRLRAIGLTTEGANAVVGRVGQYLTSHVPDDVMATLASCIPALDQHPTSNVQHPT
jgi:hypothetical protein